MNLLTEIYLRPLEKRAAFSFVGVLEFSKGAWEVRATYGLAPNLLATAKSWVRAELVQSSPSILALPLKFQDEWVGAIVAGHSEESQQSAYSEPLLKGTGHVLSALLAWKESSWEARLSALKILKEIKNENPDFNWVGIYRLDPNDSDSLLVSAYLGEATPHEKIPLHQGICGAAISLKQTLNIPDVNRDPRYLSCSITTKSELVIPLRNSQGEVVAEIDIDCVEYNGFSSCVEEKMSQKAKALENIQGLFH